MKVTIRECEDKHESNGRGYVVILVVDEDEFPRWSRVTPPNILLYLHPAVGTSFRHATSDNNLCCFPKIDNEQEAVFGSSIFVCEQDKANKLIVVNHALEEDRKTATFRNLLYRAMLKQESVHPLINDVLSGYPDNFPWAVTDRRGAIKATRNRV